jgi:3-oxoacyl-[acyl-carrier-protein] synthase II
MAWESRGREGRVRHEVVVTGFGIVSPLGLDTDEFQQRMFAGDSGVVEIRGHWVPERFPVPCAGLVPRERLGQPEVLRGTEPHPLRDFSRFACLATEEALRAVEAPLDFDAVVYATGEGMGFDLARDSFREYQPEHVPWESMRAETALERINATIGLAGHGVAPRDRLIAVNAACASGNQSIGVAFRRIRAGEWKRALVGAVDSRCNENNLMNFHLLGALTVAERPAREASRPFSLDRSGFVRAEGAASLILEERQAAEARGAKILGTVLGYGCATDAYRLTDERPDGLAVRRAMEDAIRDAGRLPREVSAISAHGTSTPMNDRLETEAIKEVFGDRAYQIPVTSLKSQTGHGGVAAGAFEAVASLLMLGQQRLAPTINYGPPDPDCDLDYVPNVARPAALETILSNNFGFGGQNTCLLLGRAC